MIIIQQVSVEIHQINARLDAKLIHFLFHLPKNMKNMNETKNKKWAIYESKIIMWVDFFFVKCTNKEFSFDIKLLMDGTFSSRFITFLLQSFNLLEIIDEKFIFKNDLFSINIFGQTQNKSTYCDGSLLLIHLWINVNDDDWMSWWKLRLKSHLKSSKI